MTEELSVDEEVDFCTNGMLTGSMSMDGMSIFTPRRISQAPSSSTEPESGAGEQQEEVSVDDEKDVSVGGLLVLIGDMSSFMGGVCWR
jgi:hypothetical protein